MERSLDADRPLPPLQASFKPARRKEQFMKIILSLLLPTNLPSLTPSQIAVIHRLEDRLMAPCGKSNSCQNVAIRWTDAERPRPVTGVIMSVAL